ncbi:MAG: hypothetical protein ACYC2T_02075 [Bacillota bacterium]
MIFFIFYGPTLILLSNVNILPITEIRIEDGPPGVKITGQDTELILEKLNIKSWRLGSMCGKKCSPSLWIKLNKDSIIGLYGLGESYAFVEIQGKSHKIFEFPLKHIMILKII